MTDQVNKQSNEPVPEKVTINLSLSAYLNLALRGIEYHKSEDGNSLNVIVDDIPYKDVDGCYQDPDEQLCLHYGIDFDYFNYIEPGENPKQNYLEEFQEDDDDEEDAEIEEGSLEDRTYRFQIKKDEDTNS